MSLPVCPPLCDAPAIRQERHLSPRPTGSASGPDALQLGTGTGTNPIAGKLNWLAPLCAFTFYNIQLFEGLVNSQFAYVSVSRASLDAQIYTNDAASLAESLSYDVSKASAIDFGKVQSPVASVGLEQAPALAKSPPARVGFAL